MKKLFCILTLLLLLPVCTVFAAEPELSLTGPETVYALDEFELHLSLNSDAVTQISFLIAYDQTNLIFLGMDGAEENGWTSDVDAGKFLLTRSGTKRDQTVLVLRFSLRNVKAGTPFWVSLTDVVVQAGDEKITCMPPRWEQTCARPVSANNYLASLKISDGVLSPTFSSGVQSYTATVSYHIAAVEVSASPEDPYAQITIHSPELQPGGVTNVMVTVTAEDGTTRVYTIAVTREDDPNRPPSSQAELESLSVTGFVISPEFQPRVTQYVLWLPYEVTSVEVVGIPKDDRATVTVEGNSRLKAGRDNPITVTCTAEDGNEKVYTIIAKRAEEYVPATTQATAVTDDPAGGEGTLPQTDAQDGSVDIPSWSYIVIAVAGITGSAAVGVLISERKK